MRYFFLYIVIIIFTGTASAQYEISVRMGIDFINSPSVVDYINQNYSPPGERLPDFNSAVIFSVEGGYNLNESYQIAVEGGYLINSYTNTTLEGKYELSYNIIMPSVMNYYVIAGNGYNFKFGGGAGLRFVNVEQRTRGIDVYETYTSTGFGFILKAQGNTLLGGGFYANIGAQIRYDINGEPENNEGPLYDGVSNNVNFNSLSAGVSLGVTYIF
jgi:hypothetical protein